VSMRTVAAGSAAVALMLIVAAPVSAQTRPATPAPAAARSSSSGTFPKTEIEVGADLGMRVLNRGVTNTYKKGWFAGASMRATSLISVIAAVSGDYQSRTGYTANIYAYSGGVRFESDSSSHKVKPFLQLMLGGAQDNGTNNGIINHYPVITPGGGVDLVASKRLAVRVRLDFPLYATFGDVYKGMRGQIGVALPIGK
jgi:hypothetical protein